jgi:hypothetical protein
MRTRTFVGLLSCMALVLCLYVTPSSNAASADEEEVMKVVTNFNTALNTLDYNLMSSLWWHSPKVSSYEPSTGFPFLYQGWDEIGVFWKANLAPSDVITNVQTLHQSQVTMLTNDVAVTTTYANNVYTDPKTKEQTISQLRQSLVVQKINGKWLIVFHHCSGLPIK